MAKAQNIPVPTGGTMSESNEASNKRNKDQFANPDMFGDKLIQWRILIYTIKFSVSLVAHLARK